MNGGSKSGSSKLQSVYSRCPDRSFQRFEQWPSKGDDGIAKRTTWKCISLQFSCHCSSLLSENDLGSGNVCSLEAERLSDWPRADPGMMASASLLHSECGFFKVLQALQMYRVALSSGESFSLADGGFDLAGRPARLKDKVVHVRAQDWPCNIYGRHL